MSMQRYICIAESLYEDKVSWLAFGMELMNTAPSSAAWRFVECCPKESGAEDFICDEAEPIPVLVKNADTGKSSRVASGMGLAYRRHRSRHRQEFHPPRVGHAFLQS